MTPAEVTAALAARGWAQDGAQIGTGARKVRLYTKPGQNPLLVVEVGGAARVFREQLRSPEHLIQGKPLGRPV